MPYRDAAKIAAYQKAYGARRDLTQHSITDLRRRHGMTPEDWAALWEGQGGCCYLCGRELQPRGRNGHPDRAIIDHVHGHCPPGNSCRICRRGLACPACNLIIGWARDDPALLVRVAGVLATVNEATLARIAAAPTQATLFG